MKTKNAYHHGDLHTELIQTAVSLIKEKGVSSLSLREVARKAGVSHGAPSHHFRDKFGLFTAIATEGFKGLAQQIEISKPQSKTQNKNNNADILINAGRAYVLFAAKNPAHFEVMFRPELHNKDDADLLNAALTALDMLKNAAEHFAPGKNNKELDALVLRSWSIAHGFAHLWISGNISPDYDEKKLQQAMDSVFAAGFSQQA